MAKKTSYIYTCSSCEHEWLAKKEGYVCPECGEIYLDEEKR